MENDIRMEKKCIIIGAGDFEPMDIDFQDGDLCIAADGGMAHCEKMQLTPDFVIGDFDSASPKMQNLLQKIEKEKPKCIVRLPAEKDDTDMLAAIRLGLEQGFNEFYLYGALGGRRIEHTFANIQCLRFIKNHDAKGCIIDKHQKLLLLQDETIEFPAHLQGYISVFALSERAEGVTIKNLKYELSDAIITNDFPIGVSNEFVGKSAKISVKKGALLVILTENK